MRYQLALILILTYGATFSRVLTPQRAKAASSARARGTGQTSAAFNAGEAAHEIARGAEKAAAAAGRKLAESARKANEGWKQKEKEDREKARQSH